MKYEYKHHTIVFTDPDRIAELNVLGAQGWRVVFVEPYEPHDRNYSGALLMREVADQPAPAEIGRCEHGFTTHLACGWIGGKRTAPQGAPLLPVCDNCGCTLHCGCPDPKPSARQSHG